MNSGRGLGLVLSLRLWQGGAGLVTTVLAVQFLNPVAQGWYYSFVSLAGLYTLFDLGLSTVLVQISAHTFAGLRWAGNDRFEGRGTQAYQGLIASAARWYAGLTLGFLIVLMPTGLLFFGPSEVQDLRWLGPWLVLCLLTGSGLLIMPFMAILEGSGQLSAVYSLRIAQAVVGSLAGWMVFAAGGELWAAAMSPGMGLLVGLGWLLASRRGLVSIAFHAQGASFNWKHEVWPMQWRLATGSLFGYFLTQINIPILFHLDGPIPAGQFGLSLTIANMLTLVAQSWIVRSSPTMANAVLNRDWTRLDQVFTRDLLVSSSVLLGAAAVFLLGYVLVLAKTPYAYRLLPLPELVGLILFALCNHLFAALAAQLRSFRKEPLMALSMASALLTIPAVFWAATVFSSAGIVSVLLMSAMMINLPGAIWIWVKCQRKWRIPA
jgi:hypothetical protein